MREQAKDADRLGPKGKWPSSGVPNSPDADDAPPAERRALTHSGTHTKRGKPVVLPTRESFLGGESKPQGEPKGLRVWEGGASECCSAMEQIRVESRKH